MDFAAVIVSEVKVGDTKERVPANIEKVKERKW